MNIHKFDKMSKENIDIVSDMMSKMPKADIDLVRDTAKNLRKEVIQLNNTNTLLTSDEKVKLIEKFKNDLKK